MTPEQLKIRIEQTYGDAVVDVVDLTGTEDHYQVTVETASFKGLTRIQQHKAVMSIFDAELKSGEIHALTIKTMTRN